MPMRLSTQEASSAIMSNANDYEHETNNSPLKLHSRTAPTETSVDGL